MAKKKVDPEKVLPGTDWELGEKIDLKLGTLKPMCHADGWVMARFNSQLPFIEKTENFIDRVRREGGPEPFEE